MQRERDPKEIDREAEAAAGAGDFVGAIELYLLAVELEPENVGRHEAIREVSLRRKAGGGMDMGVVGRLRGVRGKGDAAGRLVRAERLLAYDPLNPERMWALSQVAAAGGFWKTAAWAGLILRKAADAGGDD